MKLKRIHYLSVALLSLSLGAASYSVTLNSLASFAQAEEEKEEDSDDEIDYLALASKMLVDGHPDRALSQLREIKPKQEGVDWVRYHTLYGLAYMANSDFPKAIQSFEQSIVESNKLKKAVDPEIYLNIAQANFNQKKYTETLAALAKGQAAVDRSADAWVMKAHSHWELKQQGPALSTVIAAQKKFPKEKVRFQRMQVFYLIDLGAYTVAAEVGTQYLNAGTAQVDDFLAVGGALRAAKQFDKSRHVLEMGRLYFSDELKLSIALAHTYVDENRPFPAALVFESSSYLEPAFAYEAAELYREAGREARAVSLNARVTDQASKMKQRLSLLLGQERFEIIAGMGPELARVGLLSNDNVRYALAYALFKNGDYTACEANLKPIKDSALFESAGQLRKAIAGCRAEPDSCQ